MWSAIGLFPVVGQDLFVIGSPLFEYIRLGVGEDVISIHANGAGYDHPYVAAATINGKELSGPFCTWDELRGSEIHLEMSALTNGLGCCQQPTRFSAYDQLSIISERSDFTGWGYPE